MRMKIGPIEPTWHHVGLLHQCNQAETGDGVYLFGSNLVFAFEHIIVGSLQEISFNHKSHYCSIYASNTTETMNLENSSGSDTSESESENEVDTTKMNKAELRLLTENLKRKMKQEKAARKKRRTEKKKEMKERKAKEAAEMAKKLAEQEAKRAAKRGPRLSDLPEEKKLCDVSASNIKSEVVTTIYKKYKYSQYKLMKEGLKDLVTELTTRCGYTETQRDQYIEFIIITIMEKIVQLRNADICAMASKFRAHNLKNGGELSM